MTRRRRMPGPALVTTAALLACCACTAAVPPPRPVHIVEQPQPAALPEPTMRSIPAAPVTPARQTEATPQRATPGPRRPVVDWQIPAGRAGGISGYANRTSVAVGRPVVLYVSTAATRWRVRAFRMGWYSGRYGSLAWQSGWTAGQLQPPAQLIAPTTRTWAAVWRPSLTVPTTHWVPGDYLLRLEDSAGGMSYVPLSVRTASAAGRVVLLSPVTTWQAYNAWGCCDLYAGADGSFDSRSVAVSFDRPYGAEYGSGQFLRGELGLVATAERLGLHLDYLTDVDLQRDPGILRGARAVVSMGHDEYWSPQMRAALEAAIRRGTNVAFFGANAIYRRVRFAATPTGPDRLEINYKIAAQDPMTKLDPRATTADWPSPPDADPESRLIGTSYACNLGIDHQADGIVTDPGAWLFAGAHVVLDEHLPDLIGPETDTVQTSDPIPRPLEVVLQSPTSCPGGGPAYADATYRTAPSRAGVFDAGTIAWACSILDACATPVPPTTQEVVSRVTSNVLRAFAAGPAARRHPVTDSVATP